METCVCTETQRERERERERVSVKVSEQVGVVAKRCLLPARFFVISKPSYNLNGPF